MMYKVTFVHTQKAQYYWLGIKAVADTPAQAVKVALAKLEDTDAPAWMYEQFDEVHLEVVA